MLTASPCFCGRVYFLLFTSWCTVASSLSARLRIDHALRNIHAVLHRRIRKTLRNFPWAWPNRSYSQRQLRCPTRYDNTQTWPAMLSLGMLELTGDAHPDINLISGSADPWIDVSKLLRLMCAPLKLEIFASCIWSWQFLFLNFLYLPVDCVLLKIFLCVFSMLRWDMLLTKASMTKALWPFLRLCRWICCLLEDQFVCAAWVAVMEILHRFLYDINSVNVVSHQDITRVVLHLLRPDFRVFYILWKWNLLLFMCAELLDRCNDRQNWKKEVQGCCCRSWLGRKNSYQSRGREATCYRRHRIYNGSRSAQGPAL